MITAPQQKKTGGDRRWFVKNEQGETFGPVDFETLKLWARDGRLAPTNTVSENATSWTPVTQMPELEMDWVAEVSPGAFYGPIHRQALETLKKEGSIPADAMAFQRMRPGSAAYKTQPVSPIHPVPLPFKKEDTEALRALERQLDLERQRSHDIMKQLQQVEIHVAASEARAEACEKAHKHYASQTEQAQQHLTTQLDQANKQLTHIHAQLLAREQDLHRTEQRLLSAEHLEALVQECMTRLVSQQQELQTLVLSAQNSGVLAAAPQQETHHLEALLEQAVAQLSASVASAQAQLSVTLTQAVTEEGGKVRHAVMSSQAENQREAVAQIVQALTQGTQPIAAQLAQQGQLLQRLDEGLAALRTQMAETLVHAVTSLLDKNREETVKRICAEGAAGREQLFERTSTALTHGREQMMRATGESQRMAIEYIVRELTAVMNQSLQAGRETLLHAMRGGWGDMKQQAVALENQVQQVNEAQQRLAKELKSAMEKHAAAAAKPPVVERTYVEAEAVEVIPPERPQKKRKPEPEVMDPPPPPPKNGGASSAPGPGLSMADIEQQARRELERLGAQGMNIFKRKS